MAILISTLTPDGVPASADLPFGPDADPTLVAEITGSIEKLAIQFPELRDVRVDSKPLDEAYAEAGGGVITFDIEYLVDRAKFEKSMDYAESVRFHPRTVTCTQMEFITFHEAAHIIDQERGHAVSNALNELTWTGAVDYKELTRYSFKDGRLNTGEALANAFAAVRCNGGNQSERNINALFDAEP